MSLRNRLTPRAEKTVRRWAGVTAAVAGTAAVGSLASSAGAQSRWYRSLDKPAFQPPRIAFPLVWSSLYADLVVQAVVALGELDDDQARSYRRALGANLVLNALWSWTFFRWHRLDGAVAVAGLLSISSADLTRRTHQASPRAGRLLAPYPAWCAFATVLSQAIRRRNT